ncbi:MAG: hypothetical protein RBR75_02590 [Acholeplasmataceae bacterium]|jgi:hypothetical protein|nr:hypothetical protein [Acholeplasmataceae bacterium]
MDKKIKPIQKKKKFWTSVHQNRLKIALSLFIILIPVALILTVYIGAYTNNRKVHFDQTPTENTVYIKKFISHDEIDALTLDISWYELKHPTLNDENILTGGYYKFDLFYQPKTNYDIVSVTVTPVLQTHWTTMRSIGQSQALATHIRQIIVSFDYSLPVKPLWFVEVTDPNLYLKVDYTFISADKQVTKTAYVIFPLEDINPIRIAA